MAASYPRKKPLTADDKRFAAAVRRARQDRGWTVRDLAERAGIDHGQIVRIEHADPELVRGATYATAVKIARVLDMSVDELARLGDHKTRRTAKKLP